MCNTVECVSFVVFDSYASLIHSWQLTTKNYCYQFSTRPLLLGWCLCPDLYGSTQCPPPNMTQARDIFDDALATAMHAMQTNVATTLRSTSGALAFTRDMFLNIPLIADWQAMHALVNIMSMKIYNVPIGSSVSMTTLRDNKFWRKCTTPTKLGVRMGGPYTIERVNVNSNLIIILHEGVTERNNILRVLPYC
jgi:hypothetical protein